MPRSRILLNSEGTIQVNRVNRTGHLRNVSARRTTVIQPESVGDIEIVASTASTADYTVPGTGAIFLVNGRIVHVAASPATHYGRAAFVDRYGDAFSLDYSSNNTPDQLITGRPRALARSSTGATFTRRSFNFAQLDDIIVMHNVVMPSSASLDSWDEFTALRLDMDSLTGTWDDTQRPLDPYSTIPFNASTHTLTPFRMATLDGSTVVVAGAAEVASGFIGQLFMVQYDNGATPTGQFTSYGPFGFGSISAEGDAYPIGADGILVRLDASRVMVVWQQYAESDASSTTYMYARRPLFAQVFTYDTTAHTMVAGDQYVFESGLEGGGGALQAHWYENGEVLVVAGINYSTIDNLDVGSTSYVGLDYNLTARTLRVTGTVVTEGTTHYRVASMGGGTNPEDYWYGFQMVGAADRLVFVWPEANDAGSTIKYTKVRIGLSGHQRGALGSYGTGVLFADEGLSREIYENGTMIQLDGTSSLAMFEQYLDNYALTSHRSVLAREV